ncbi:MAG: PAS domain-containing protein, partial [Ilumatobacteraceae bacterium]
MGGSADRVSPQGLTEISTILDALQRAVILTDCEMMITGWNAKAEQLYGWPTAEAIGRSVYDLITPPDLLDVGRSVMADVLAGHTWTGDIRVLRRDGSQRLTFSFINPVVDASGKIVGAISSANDITDARRLEREASTAADHLLLAFAAGDVGTWRWDRRGSLMSWDDAMCRLFGIEPSAFDGESWQHLVHPDDLERVTSNLAAAIEHRGAYEVDFRVIWADRSEHWIDSRGKVFVGDANEVLGTIGYATEITDRKAAELDARRRAADAERLANDESRQRLRLEFLVGLNDLAIQAVDHRDLMRRTAMAAVPRLGDWCTVHFAPQPGVHEIEVAHSDPDRMEW